MNERILELAKQAGLKKEHSSDREYIGDFDWRQFAELIVQECIDYCGENLSTTVGGALKIHFGVEK